MSSIPVGVTTNPFKEDLRDRYERGFQFVELRMSEALLVGRRVEIAGEIERILDEYDLDIVSLHVPEFHSNGHPVDFISFNDKLRAEGFNLVEATLQVAAAIGAPRVVLTLPPFVTMQQTTPQDPSKWLTLIRHRLLTNIEKFVNLADLGKTLLCLKNAPPIIGHGPEGGAFFGMSTLLTVQGILNQLGELTRAWVAFDVPNAYLFCKAWSAAHEGNQQLNWIDRLEVTVPLAIQNLMSELAGLTEIFYLSNVQGFTNKGLLPEDGELNFTTIYKHILTCIFPQRAIVLDVQEEHEEKAVNAELMSAFIRQIG